MAGILKNSFHDIFPDNPLIFVFIGHNVLRKCEKVEKYYGHSDSHIFIQIYKNFGDKVQNDNVIGINLNNEGKLELGYQHLIYLEQAVRKTKRHKYVNRGDADVCVIIDNPEEDTDFMQICSQLYDTFKDAYFSHVFLDIYYLMSEEFLKMSHNNKLNYLFLKQVEQLEKNEWIRFIFLLSEMTNEEILAYTHEELFEMALDSIIMGNCERLHYVNGSRRIYENLSETALDHNSKLVTLGRMPLYLEDDKVKKVLLHGLIEELSQCWAHTRKIAESFPLGLNVLCMKIQTCVSKLKEGITAVGYYESVSAQDAARFTYGEILGRCFQNNHLEYIRINRFLCQKECENITTDFCHNQFDVFLKDNLQQCVWNIFDTEFADLFIMAADKEIKKYLENILKELSAAKEKLVFWKQRKADFGTYRKKDQYCGNYQMAVLIEWSTIYSEVLSYEMLQNCLSDVRYYLNEWRDKIYSVCREMNNYREKITGEMNILFQDSNRTGRIILRAVQKNLKYYLGSNKDTVRNCYCDIYNSAFEENNTNFILYQIIQKCVDRMLVQNRKEIRNWGTKSDQDSHTAEFYRELYAEVLNSKVMQMRGSVYNMEPFICFVGPAENEFIRYLESYEGNMVYAAKGYDSPAALYYQHIHKINDLFVYALYDKIYGE